MMTERLSTKAPTSGFPDFHLDGDIYQLDWNDIGVPDPLSTSGLPSLDYALYLFETTRFRVGQIYRIFEAEPFRTRIHDLYYYREPAATATSRVWFVQFLLVLAFGNAFLSRKKGRNPPGSRYFARAMSIVPKHMAMGKDCFMVMEALALASMYLYAVDYREEAHINVSLASDCSIFLLTAPNSLDGQCELHSSMGYTHSFQRKTLAPRQWQGVRTFGGPCISWIARSRSR